ncbi:hypothetical protein ACLF6K_29915 [Streptomyces xanthophaeus]|uniref:hypothetical protein n=1 Tax=Streptomyces xanthophaeus TaxID=67385 RepID=UPI00398F9A26
MIKHLLRGTAALALALAATAAPATAYAADAPTFTCRKLTFSGRAIEAGPCGVTGSPAPLQPAYIIQADTGYKWYCPQTLGSQYMGAWVVKGRDCKTSG